MDSIIAILVPLSGFIGAVTGILALVMQRKKLNADAAATISSASASLVKQYQVRVSEIEAAAKEVLAEMEEKRDADAERLVALEGKVANLQEALRERDREVSTRQEYIEHLLRVIQRLILQLKSLDKEPVAEPRPYAEFSK